MPTPWIRVLSRAETPREIPKRLIELRHGLTQLGDGVRMLGVPKRVLGDPGSAATTSSQISVPAKLAWHIATRSKGMPREAGHPGAQPASLFQLQRWDAMDQFPWWSASADR